MTREKRGANGNLTVEVLKDIREQLRTGFAELRAGLGEVRAGVDEVRAGVDEVRAGVNDVRDGLAATNARLDIVTARLENIRDLAGEKYRELVGRVGALEARMDKLQPA